ncbi:MAG: YlcI/YnfO family protein [Rhodanobacteraceae bacterium]
MKTATLPSLRVDPELRQSAEAVLRKGESLSSFMEQSLRDEVNRRRMRSEFLARGIASRNQARRKSEYIEADVVHAELRAMLAKAKA